MTMTASNNLSFSSLGLCCIIKARKFAKAMKAPLVFCSAHSSENVQKIFKIVLAKAFELKCTIEPITKAGEAILEY